MRTARLRLRVGNWVGRRSMRTTTGGTVPLWLWRCTQLHCWLAGCLSLARWSVWCDVPRSHDARDVARYQVVRAASLVHMMMIANAEGRRLYVVGPKSGAQLQVMGVTESDPHILIRVYSFTTHSEREWKRLPDQGVQVIRRGFDGQ